jgi:DNA topoisomerase VI subunit B
MTIGESMLPEFDLEMATTRRVLERVPTEKGEWKPHPKSFALGHLTQLVARMPSWMTTTLKNPDLNLANFRGYSFETTPTLLEEFDKNVRDAREALAAAKDDDDRVVRVDEKRDAEAPSLRPAGAPPHHRRRG